MKKIKSPWYGVVWIVIWTAALIWFLTSGMFNPRESVGLALVWLIFVSITGYLIGQHLRLTRKAASLPPRQQPAVPSLNAPCPCGSGKKYKRCCGAPSP